MKLLKELKKKPFCNEIHFIMIAVILLMISLKYYIFFIFLFLYLIYLFRLKHLLFPLLIIIIIISIRIISISIIKNNLEKKDNYETYVIDVKNENSYYVYIGLNKVLIYDYNHDVTPGDIITLSIKFNNNLKSYENDFDEEEYNLGYGINYSGKAKNRIIKSHGFSIYSLKYYYLKYLSNVLSENSFNYVSTMVFGNNRLENNMKESYSALGISHILAISGLHLIFLYKIISFILLKIFHYYDDKIQLIFLSIYVMIIGFPPSVLRALLFLLLDRWNRNDKISYSKLDILSISFLIMIIFRPYFIYNYGFILSFLVTFILIFSNEIIKENNKILNAYKIYILIFIFTFPIVSNITNNISIFSILLSPILSLIISFILIPISYLLTILPILDFILKYLIILFNIYVSNLSDYLLLIHIQSFNIYMTFGYYIIAIFLLYSYLKKKKLILHLILYFGYILCIIYLRFLNPFGMITFIDVGQGDSALIRLPYSNGIILIDAYNSFDYLKTLGINTIDYLVLTHSDNDHIGDYKEIINYYNVKELIYPIYDDRFMELLDGLNVKSIGINDKYNIKNKFDIDVLGPINQYDDPNSNSIVIKLKIEDNDILFTGDMTEKEEEDLINKYGNKLKSDILKVAHHGSKTSSSDKFIKLVNPDISIISVGLDNYYGLPDDIVVNKLKKISKVYMTKDCGNIDIKFLGSRRWIDTYR